MWRLYGGRFKRFLHAVETLEPPSLSHALALYSLADNRARARSDGALREAWTKDERCKDIAFIDVRLAAENVARLDPLGFITCPERFLFELVMVSCLTLAVIPLVAPSSVITDE